MGRTLELKFGRNYTQGTTQKKMVHGGKEYGKNQKPGGQHTTIVQYRFHTLMDAKMPQNCEVFAHR
jgi:hypothetical protein